jgi:hypothetical protein
MTEEDKRLATILQEWFILRSDCKFEIDIFANKSNKELDEENNDNNTQPKIVMCPNKADYLTCFPATLPNQTFYTKCPYKKGLKVKTNSNGNGHIFKFKLLIRFNDNFIIFCYSICK